MATIFSLGAQPIESVAASAQLVAADDSVSAKTGCPEAIGVDLGVGERCVSWPVSMFLQETEDPGGACDQALFMLVPLSKNADGYLALWNRTGPHADPSPGDPWGFTSTTGGPYGEEIWSTTTITPQKTGVNVNYDVPGGDGAWFVAAGGEPCSLLASEGDVTGVAQAWVVTYKRKVAGQVTVDGSAAPAPNITMNASCPSGGTTTTDKNGYYAFLLDKGTCTIAPQLPAGLVSTPRKRALDVTTDIDNVNFQVPCNAVDQGTDNGAANGPFVSDLAGDPGGDCPLKVYIKIVGPVPNVGTRSGLSIDDYMPDQGPVNFSRLTYSRAASPLVAAGDEGQDCVSGCANLLITVIDPITHEPATHATVDVDLGAIDTEASPDLAQQGHQFLCVQSDGPTGQCGAGLSGLRVDNNGQVRLIYWAPGEAVAAHVELTAHATSKSACGCGESSGSATSRLSIEPYRVFHGQGELDPEVVQDLVELVKYHGYFSFASKTAEKVLETAADNFLAEEELEKTAVAAVLGPFGWAFTFLVVDVAHMAAEILEADGLRAKFLDAVGLAEPGLDVGDPFAKQLDWTSFSYFDDTLLTDTFAIYNYPSGWLWELAKYLAEQYPQHNVTGVSPEHLDLSVYEMSYCNQGAECGPGYQTSRGIQTKLCFFLTASSPGGQWEHFDCQGVDNNEYDAPIWVVSQEALDTHLGRPDALNTSLP
jgi:hypothetical protein